MSTVKRPFTNADIDSSSMSMARRFGGYPADVSNR